MVSLELLLGERDTTFTIIYLATFLILYYLDLVY